MDALLLALANVSHQLLPILGAVALFFLCIALRKLGLFVDELTTTVKNLDPTIKKVDASIEKAQAPLDTVVKFSHTLDNVHDKTGEVMEKVSQFTSDNIGAIKSNFSNKDEVQDHE